VRRILAARYRPSPDSAGPSWLTVLGHTKDSLWSLDLFRCESAVLRTHWVLVVMDHCTRRIVGFAVHRGVVDSVGLCRMFNRATRGHTPPTYVSSDHDPLYRFHQWQVNLRILDRRRLRWTPRRTPPGRGPLRGNGERSSVSSITSGFSSIQICLLQRLSKNPFSARCGTPTGPVSGATARLVVVCPV